MKNFTFGIGLLISSFVAGTLSAKEVTLCSGEATSYFSKYVIDYSMVGFAIDHDHDIGMFTTSPKIGELATHFVIQLNFDAATSSYSFAANEGVIEIDFSGKKPTFRFTPKNAPFGNSKYPGVEANKLKCKKIYY